MKNNKIKNFNKIKITPNFTPKTMYPTRSNNNNLYKIKMSNNNYLKSSNKTKNYFKKSNLLIKYKRLTIKTKISFKTILILNSKTKK